MPTEPNTDLRALADEAPLKRWRDMQGRPKEIIACGERWAGIASIIGCTVHGYNDDFGASFYTPDGGVIKIGPKLRPSSRLCEEKGRERRRNWRSGQAYQPFKAH